MRNALNPQSVADLPLFSRGSERAAQAENIERVRGRIAATVREFCKLRLANGKPEFWITDLHAFVQRAHPGAPASPDRILRDLRQRGVIAYEVLSRAESLYRLTAVSR